MRMTTATSSDKCWILFAAQLCVCSNTWVSALLLHKALTPLFIQILKSNSLVRIADLFTGVIQKMWLPGRRIVLICPWIVRTGDFC
jgi:hypothetical protein